MLDENRQQSCVYSSRAEPFRDMRGKFGQAFAIGTNVQCVLGLPDDLTPPLPWPCRRYTLPTAHP